MLTEVKGYDFSWQDFAERRLPIPPGGLKFDIHFEGDVTGERIRGRLKGVDHLTVRAYELPLSDQSHFIREFKHYAGMAPRKFLEGREGYIVNAD